ncbi:hypothetical protein SERLADRAFT_443585 [Serpula lacrymans var. lacrymans S7.9]|uniref:Uncharacterized protein n=1 Tax=Serpula lacrymans var. lacrymans (strain S7.9) TaxID=578457 RepID=F8PCU7_SERL9|nr:uncharacterized protein SERLADRAFT_443585 [Serpula lacrymans var. lacrymans S7.9]EGO19046.1 hypothetical protein SERLADRAFT_443585 [Serpula lacrymans var. lacrymans S7.9]
MTDAESILEDHKMSAGIKKTPTSAVSMDGNMAKLLLAPCLVAEQNRLYTNPVVNSPFTCSMCIVQFSHPSTQCLCSGCDPASCPPQITTPPKVPKLKAMEKSKHLSKDQQKMAVTAFEEVCGRIYDAAPSLLTGLLPSAAFLLDNTIKILVKRVTSLQCLADLAALTTSNGLLQPHLHHVWNTIQQLRTKLPLSSAQPVEVASKDCMFIMDCHMELATTR